MCTQLCESHVFEDEDVRKQVAWALGKIGDARAAEPLTEALKDGWGGCSESCDRGFGEDKGEEKLKTFPSSLL